MLLLEVIDEFIEMLRPLYIDETKFYDTFPASRKNDPPVEVLNIHAVRLFAGIAGIGIVEGTTKVMQEPDFEQPDPEIVVCSYASWDMSTKFKDGTLHSGRGYYAEVSQKTHWPPRGQDGPRMNPNYRETAISRAERNAMLGLIPARYVLFRIKELTKEKNQMRSDMEKVNQARVSARAKASILEQGGVSSSTIFEEVKSIRSQEIENWGVEDWNFLESEFDRAISEQIPREPGDEAVDEQADSLPEAEVTSEDVTPEELADAQGEF